MRDLPDEMLAVPVGSKTTIAYARSSNGKFLAKEYLDGLGPRDTAVFDRFFSLMASTGRIANRERYKKVEDQIWEFKSFQARIGVFRIGSILFLTHGFKKQRDKWPKPETRRAKRIRAEHLEWPRRHA